MFVVKEMTNGGVGELTKRLNHAVIGWTLKLDAADDRCGVTLPRLDQTNDSSRVADHIAAHPLHIPEGSRIHTKRASLTRRDVGQRVDLRVEWRAIDRRDVGTELSQRPRPPTRARSKIEAAISRLGEPTQQGQRLPELLVCAIRRTQAILHEIGLTVRERTATARRGQHEVRIEKGPGAKRRNEGRLAHLQRFGTDMGKLLGDETDSTAMIVGQRRPVALSCSELLGRIANRCHLGLFSVVPNVDRPRSIDRRVGAHEKPSVYESNRAPAPIEFFGELLFVARRSKVGGQRHTFTVAGLGWPIQEVCATMSPLNSSTWLLSHELNRKGGLMSYEAPTVGTIAPVEDWVHDFDLFEDGYVRDPYSIWESVRDCPVLTSDRWGGSHLVIGYDAVVQGAANTSALTSTLGTSAAPTLDDHRDPERPRSIINSDPPDHAPVRRVILPSFSPQAVATYEPVTRVLCESLMAKLLAANPKAGDAAADYAQQIPARVIGRILGVPESMTDEFIGWVRDVLETGVQNPQQRKVAFDSLNGYLAIEIAKRRETAQDDLITRLTQATLDGGAPLRDRDIIGNLALLLVAGIDTTWSAIGASLLHLAEHREHRAQLRNDPSLWPTAIEEFLRAFAPVTMGRIALRDTEVARCPVSEGRRVLLSFPAANRDPKMFENPNEVRLDRAHNRHMAFGSGIHRCAGSNLARMELRVALQVWLEHVPEFSLVDATLVTWAGGQVRGPRSIPVTIGV